MGRTTCSSGKLHIPWLLALAASLTAPVAGAELPARPNIVLILADDFGYECVRANGGTSYRTPHLDRLAREGVRFEHCYSQPLCTPTRVQLLTGLYNQRNYVRFAHLDRGEGTFAQMLLEAGYRTCVAGKWQLGGGEGAPRHFGFEEHLLWQLTRREARYANPVLEKDGRRMVHRQGEYGPDLISSFACDFIRRRKEGPFLLFYPMVLTHGPFEPTPDSPDWNPRARGAAGGAGNPRHFPAMVAYADKEVGRILQVLDELRLREKTLVIFTADNGTARAIRSRLDGREVIGGKGRMTDAATRVPLIVSWPGVVREGAVSSELVDSTDFLPTLLEAAGVAPPDDLRPDGRSFLPQLRGEKGRPREWVYTWFSRNGGPTGRESARDLRYRLHGDGRFFDVSSDPEESRDLARDVLSPEATAARERLARVLESFRGTRKLAGGQAPEARAVEKKAEGKAGTEPEKKAAKNAPAASPGREAARKRIEELGGSFFRLEGQRRVEVSLNRRPVADEDLRLVAQIDDLTDLSLEETPVGDPGVEHLASLRKLEWLNLYRTRVGDAGLAHLSRIPSLKLLPVGETRVTDAGLVHLERMPQLEYLGLRGNRITDAGLVHVAKLRRLKGLHLGDTAAGDTGLGLLAGLEKLETLWLDRTAITDAAVDHLARFRSLKELHLAGTRLTPRGIEALRAALRDCEVVTEP